MPNFLRDYTIAQTASMLAVESLSRGDALLHERKSMFAICDALSAATLARLLALFALLDEVRLVIARQLLVRRLLVTGLGYRLVLIRCGRTQRCRRGFI
jgi:hypothetical protein